MQDADYKEKMDELYRKSDNVEMRLGRYTFEARQLESEIEECYQELKRLERQKEALFLTQWEKERKTYGSGDGDVLN